MGNSQTKEARGPPLPARTGPFDHREPGEQDRQLPTSSRHRNSLPFLGIGASSNNDAEAEPPRRETKQEREARKLEKERIARERERERSMREENVDGGFLVTLGVYTGIEDFSKPTVRQLMIERRLAPFWRSIEEHNDDWVEHQIVAAARGLPIPAADEMPPQDNDQQFGGSHPGSNANLRNLTIPLGSRTATNGSDKSAHLSPSHPAFSALAATSTSLTGHASSIFRPRSKTLASLTASSKNASEEQLTPQELQLPEQPTVNGLPVEVVLYREVMECPICFQYYPPLLNKTRCCDQAICSECFVQIKRPDPHPPHVEHDDSALPQDPVPVTEEAESLVSEPAMCPYCQKPEFGVTYDPPSFRRGLAYANTGTGNVIGSNITSAMSSSTSLTSMGSPTTPTGSSMPPRRRTTSLSANASSVITTDRIRPDWAVKLSAARSHAARRAAAATALHTAAYLMNGQDAARGFSFGSRARFARLREMPDASGSSSPVDDDRDVRVQRLHSALTEARRRDNNAARASHRSRLDDLDDMMMMEAIRLSLAEEENRVKKEEKKAAKEAKKNEKAEKKAEKAAEKKSSRLYASGGGSGEVSKSGSTLSLSLGNIGRKRGNSGSSAFLREATVNSAVGATAGSASPSSGENGKGKGVDRINSSTTTATAPINIATSKSMDAIREHGISADSSILSHSSESLGAIGISADATEPRRSHLRQMSNASSQASSFADSIPGSHHGHGLGLANSRSSLDIHNLSPGAGNGHGRGTIAADGGTGTPGTEPMFNFRSLAAMIEREDGVPIPTVGGHRYSEADGGHGASDFVSGRRTSDDDVKDSGAQHVEDAAIRAHRRVDSSTSAFNTSDEPYGLHGSPNGGNITESGPVRLSTPVTSTPALMVTPGTPGAQDS